MANKKKQTVAENIEAVAVTESIIEKYRKHILYGIVGIIVVAAIIIGYVQLIHKPNVQEAAEAIAKCQVLFQNNDFDKALNGDGQECIGFIQVAEQYGCTPSGNLANLYAGLCLAQQKKFEEAKGYLEDFDTQDDQMISPAALAALGNVYANLGENGKAAGYLVKAAKKADNNSLSPSFLIQAGELFEAEGENAKALDCYKQIKEKYINSMAFQEIDKYIERVSE